MTAIATHTEQEALLERIVADMPPMPEAACVGRGEMFFGTDTEREQNAEAKNLCLTECPELNPCRDWALNNPHLTPHGVWGGMTVKERNKIRRRNQPAERRRRKRG